MTWKERVRVVSERFLDMAGFTSSPREQAPYQFSNDLQRAIAHLAAFDGTYSRLLRVLESGVLRTSPEGVAERPFPQGVGGFQEVDVHFLGGVMPRFFPSACFIASPVWGAVVQSGSVLHTATGTATSSVDFSTGQDRTVYVGPMNRAMLLYNSATPGAETMIVGQFDTGAHDPQYFHTDMRYLDFKNAGSDIDVAVVWWN